MLEALLDLIYINVIVENVFSSVRLYADGCVLYSDVSCNADIFALQSDLDKIKA